MDPAFVFGLLGNAISTGVYLAPIPTFYRICKKKSTEGFESIPYLVTLFSSMLWFYYALLKGNLALVITINSFGCFIELIYIIIFLIYATRDARKLTIKHFVLMNLGAFSLITLVTKYAVPPPLQVTVYGWICTTISVCVFVSPLSVLRQVIKTKSVEFMPFNLSFFLTLNAVMWFGYGLFRHDMCIYIPNIIGFCLGIFQMGLYAKYRRAEKAILKEKMPNSMKEIVIVGNNGSTEVYSVNLTPVSVVRNGANETQEQGNAKNLGKNEKATGNEVEEKDHELGHDITSDSAV